ncbi:MAG TPA: hypothetical protein VGS02_00300 [Acidobacteriaceae bacterium]|nr:hypothetical protein [Acidobacteriaceae bacterium]
MPAYCLLLLHWLVLPNNSLSMFLFVVLILAVLVVLERFVFGRKSKAEPAIPRVQSICEDMRRKMTSADEAATLDNSEISEDGALSHQL